MHGEWTRSSAVEGGGELIWVFSCGRLKIEYDAGEFLVQCDVDGE